MELNKNNLYVELDPQAFPEGFISAIQQLVKTAYQLCGEQESPSIWFDIELKRMQGEEDLGYSLRVSNMVCAVKETGDIVSSPDGSQNPVIETNTKQLPEAPDTFDDEEGDDISEMNF